MGPSTSDIFGDFERTGEREMERERERTSRLRSASTDPCLPSAPYGPFLRGDLDPDLPLLSELNRSRRGIGPFLAHSMYMASPRKRLP